MAGYNEIQVGRFNRFAQKYFGIKGRAPVSSLGADLQIFHKVFSGQENRYPEGWNRFGWGIATAATVGQTNSCHLRNPPTSNVVVVFEKLVLGSSLAQEYDLGISPNGGSQSVAGYTPLDNRQGIIPTTQGALIVSTAITSQSVGNIFARMLVPPAIGQEFINHPDQEFILLPNMTMQVVQTLANSTMLFSVIWRERFLEEPERL